MRALVAGRLAGIWRRIFQILAESIPEWMYLPGFRQYWARRVVLSRVSGRQLSMPKLPPGTLVDVLLDDSFFLKRQFQFPAAARTSLAQAIDLQVRQSFPANSDTIQHRYCVLQQNASHISAETFVLSSRHLNDVTQAAHEAGLRIRTIRIAAAPDVSPFLDNRNTTDRPLRIWTGAIVGLVLIGGLIFWVAEYRKVSLLREQLALLSDQNTTLANQAVARRETLESADTAAARIIADANRFEAEGHLLPILLDLTDALPDSVWLSELFMSNGVITLSGMSEDEVAEVIQILSGIGWVDRAEIATPVFFDRTSGRNRFEIKLVVNSIGEQQE